MEYKDLLVARRSIRKYKSTPIDDQTIQKLLDATLTAPSSRNTRSTRLMVLTNPDDIAHIAAMRDYGSSFSVAAPLMILVMGNTTASDMWLINSSISATILQLACTDLGLASCWVHVHTRPCLKSEPEGKMTIDHIREKIDIPENYDILCAMAIGYSDFTPAALPEFDPSTAVIWRK